MQHTHTVVNDLHVKEGPMYSLKNLPGHPE